MPEQILRGGEEQLRRVLKLAKRMIALRTEKTANFAGRMIVIDRQRLKSAVQHLRLRTPTDCAHATLSAEHFVNIHRRDAKTVGDSLLPPRIIPSLACSPLVVTFLSEACWIKRPPVLVSLVCLFSTRKTLPPLVDADDGFIMSRRTDIRGPFHDQSRSALLPKQGAALTALTARIKSIRQRAVMTATAELLFLSSHAPMMGLFVLFVKSTAAAARAGASNFNLVRVGEV